MGWSVVGPLDELADDTACQGASCSFKPISAIGDAHPASPLLICSSINTEAGLTERLVLATFTVPDGTINTDPIYTIRQGADSVQIDQDADGKPIVSTGGFQLQNRINEDFPIITISVSVVQPFYDINYAVSAANKVNAAPKAFPALGTSIDAGVGRILGVLPASQIQAGTNLPRVVYSIACKGDGWTQSRASESTRGWFKDPDGTSRNYPFCDTAGHYMDAPVLVNPQGIPYDSSVMVRATTGIKSPGPVPGNVYVPDSSDVTDDGVVTIVKYRTKKTFDFDSLPF